MATACPTVHWLDGGELTAAAFHLVPAHAPGEPLFVLLGKLVTLIPLGSIAFRVNLLSSFSAAAAAYVANLVVLSWLDRTVPVRAPWQTPAVAALVVGGIFLGYPVWIQSVRAEVYTLHLLLALLGIATAWKAGEAGGLDPRWTASSALVWGLALAVHPLLAALAFLPTAGIALGRSPRWRPRTWLGAAAGGIAGWSTCLLLPVRALAHPGFGWGDGGSFAGFTDLMLARSFQRNFSPATLELVTHNLAVLGRLAVDHVGPTGLVLGTAGLAWLLLVKRQLQGLLALMVLLFTLLSIVPQNKVYGDNPDLLGYLALPLAVVWMAAGVATCSAAVALGKRIPLWTAPLVLLVACLPVVVLSVRPSDRSNDFDARELGQAAFDRLDPGAILVVSGNDTTFLTQYLQEVEQARPDVLVLPRALVTHPWFRARLPYSDPWLHAALGPVATFASLVKRPVRVELREQDLASAQHLCPVPAPGWGFFDIGPCPDLGNPDGPRPLGGLFRPGRPDTSTHALLLGANAILYLGDYYRATGHADWADRLLEKLEQTVPGLAVPATTPSEP